MRLTVRNGTVVSSSGTYRADIVCDRGRISSIEVAGSSQAGDEDIDAAGMLVFPGFIDPHVHSRDPGLTHKEDFAHSTAAAAAGGVTTILEMPNTVPPVTDVDVLRHRASHHSRVARVDFGLWGMSLGAANLSDIPSLLEAGAVGVKLFWGYALDIRTRQLVYNVEEKSADELIPPPRPAEVLDVFAAVASHNGLLAAHCEDRDVIQRCEREYGREMTEYPDLLACRPDTAEAAAVALGIEFSRHTACRFHVVHIASARAVELIRTAQRARIPVSGETCPHYLTFTDESYEAVGTLMKVYPPIRRRADQQALWNAVADGTIVSVGSDHAPHTIEEKRLPLDTQPAGILGVETMVRLMLNEAARGRVAVHTVAWVLAEGTARLYGLYPAKGAILPGSDADFTIVHPQRRWVIHNDGLHSKNPISPWDGWSGEWSPVYAILRGQTIMRDGEPVGAPAGRWVRPNATAKRAIV